jgi:hypothetical protein
VSDLWENWRKRNINRPKVSHCVGLEPPVKEYGLNQNQAMAAWFSLQEYKDKLQHDLETKYDGDPEFGLEDEMFLTNTLGSVTSALWALKEQGFQP